MTPPLTTDQRRPPISPRSQTPAHSAAKRAEMTEETMVAVKEETMVAVKEEMTVAVKEEVMVAGMAA